MRYAGITDLHLHAIHVSDYSSCKDEAEDVSVKSGRLAELVGTTIFTNEPEDTGKPVFNGRLFDLATNEEITDRPVILKSREEARDWWASVAPEAPIPATLQENTKEVS